MKIEMLTAELFEKFEGKKPPSTVKGIAMTDGDKVYGICCIAFMNKRDFVVCGINEGADLRALIQGWGIFTSMMDEGKTYYAMIDRNKPTAEGFVKHFGFKLVEKDLYIYTGDL